MMADLSIGSPGTVAGRGPASQARHLRPGTLPQWRALLEFLWQERLERVTEFSVAYHDAADAASAVGTDRSAQRAARRRAAGILHQAVAERRALAEIEAALERLARGNFAYCEQCGGVIATSMLAETPQARYCAACDC